MVCVSSFDLCVAFCCWYFIVVFLCLVFLICFWMGLFGSVFFVWSLLLVASVLLILCCFCLFLVVFGLAVV